MLFKVMLIVNPFAPEPNTIPLTSVEDESDRAAALERPKVAVSDGPFGTVCGVQLAAVFQSPLVGLRFQVALPLLACWPTISNRLATRTPRNLEMECRRRGP